MVQEVLFSLNPHCGVQKTVREELLATESATWALNIQSPNDWGIQMRKRSSLLEKCRENGLLRGIALNATKGEFSHNCP